MIAFIFDDRLPHDRKSQFQRTVTMLKSKYQFEVLPVHFSEEDVIEFLDKNSVNLLLLPWYKYVEWKKIDSYLGALRMERTSVAGYFADPVLPFEFAELPNQFRHLLLDFYRMDQREIELVIQILSHPMDRSGFGMLPPQTPVFHTQWMEKDSRSTHCIDELMGLPLFTQHHWKDRSVSLRLFLTSLWSFAMPNPILHPSPQVAMTEVELVEFRKILMIKAVFRNQLYTLKNTMEWLWPNTIPTHPSVRGMLSQVDFFRVIHFPESQQLEITGFFTEANPVFHYPNEVRGFWIEPQKVSQLKRHENHLKRISVKSFLTHKKKAS